MSDHTPAGVLSYQLLPPDPQLSLFENDRSPFPFPVPFASLEYRCILTLATGVPLLVTSDEDDELPVVRQRLIDLDWLSEGTVGEGPQLRPGAHEYLRRLRTYSWDELLVPPPDTWRGVIDLDELVELYFGRLRDNPEEGVLCGQECRCKMPPVQKTQDESPTIVSTYPGYEALGLIEDLTTERGAHGERGEIEEGEISERGLDLLKYCSATYPEETIRCLEDRLRFDKDALALLADTVRRKDWAWLLLQLEDGLRERLIDALRFPPRMASRAVRAVRITYAI